MATCIVSFYTECSFYRASQGTVASWKKAWAIANVMVKKRKKVKSLSHVQLFAIPWTIAYQGPLSMGLSRQEYWSGLPFPSTEDLPNPGTEPGSPALQAEALPSETRGMRTVTNFQVPFLQDGIPDFKHTLLVISM